MTDSLKKSISINDGLKEKYRQTLIQILTTYPGVEGAILFGSRARGNFRPGSDIDLALIGQTLTLADLIQLKDLIEQTNIPHKVDILLMHKLNNPNLHQSIQSNGIRWF